MIPKIFHQTYRDAVLPDPYGFCQAELLRLHPDYEYRFYSDADIISFIKTEFPDYWDAFHLLPRMIMKIDMFRYFLMYRFGGIYADMDYLFLNPIGPALSGEIVLPANREENGVAKRIGNCIFASEPGHPFWKSLMDTLHTYDRAIVDDGFVEGSPQGTGPQFVYDMWTKTSLPFVPRAFFHPETRTSPSYMESLRLKGTIGMHLCSGLWRDGRL